MIRIVWAPQALEDVHAIRTYLSRDSADSADLIVERMASAVLHPLRAYPTLGVDAPALAARTMTA